MDGDGFSAMGDPLLSEIYKNDPNLLAVVKRLLDGEADPNVVTEYGESPLRVASYNGRFDVIELLLKSGADPKQLRWTNLFHEIAFGTLENIKNLLSRGADLTARDYWRRTPWLLSLQFGDIEKAELLLAAGSDPTDRGKCGKTAMAHAIQSYQGNMLLWLIGKGFDVEAYDDFGGTPLCTAAELGATECVRILVEAGADVLLRNPIKDGRGYKAIELADNLEIVRILVDAGEDLNDVSNEMRAALVGLEFDKAPLVSEEDYWLGKNRRFGISNPEQTNNEFWKAMVQSGAQAWHARDLFGDTDIVRTEPVWCFQRHGKSINDLGDGRFIEIAGEHEDHYDPDFCIYNDVVVHQGKGEFDIFIYSRDVFPPTDFHTATLVDQHIYIIGNLGYPEDTQAGHTPVYRLHIDTLRIEEIRTSGESPGWISKHKAYCRDGTAITIRGGKVIVGTGVEEKYLNNRGTYYLSLRSFEWSRVE